MLPATISGQRGRSVRAAGAPTAGGPRAAAALAALVLTAVTVGLAGCGAQDGPATTAAGASTNEGESPARPAVSVAPDLDGAESVNAVNDAGDMVISRAGPAGTEFFYLARGAQPVPLTHDGAPLDAHLLNNAGQVVGIVADATGRQPPRLVRWQDGKSTVLPVSGDEIIPEDLNEHGQVTAIAFTQRPQASQGTDTTRTARAYLTDATTAVDLGVDPDSNEHSLYLNEAGQVTGLAFVDAGRSPHGFLWDHGKLTTFDTGPATHPVVMGINDAGQVVGLVLSDQDQPSGADPVFRQAFRWESGTMTMLDTLGGGAGPVRINRSGQVAAVVADSASSQRDVVIWSAAPDARPTRLGISGADYVVDVNDQGDILVSSTSGPTGSPGGRLWHDGRVSTLGTLGGVAADPKALTADGLVVGASTSADGTWHAAAWPPGASPTPSAQG